GAVERRRARNAAQGNRSGSQDAEEFMIASLAAAALVISQSVELSLLVKATLILLAAFAAVALARTARASIRHLMLSSVFVALIALPLLLISVPRFTIDVAVTSK